jgi:hypothetical protein
MKKILLFSLGILAAVTLISCGGGGGNGGGGTVTAANIAVTDSVNPNNDLQVPYGSIAQGNTSDQTITVTNSGNANLVIGTIASVNPLAAPFSITVNNCSGQTIAPAGSCTLTVRFAPAGTGSFTDSFDIPSNDPDTSSVTLTLSGTGIVATNAIALPRTGQTICSSETGTVISCVGTGQDGDLLKGVVWPSPRFTVGTGGGVDCVTDNLSGLMWTKNANLAGLKSWQAALEYVAAMNSGAGLCGYTDWRLPNRKELRSLIDYSRFNPALSAGHPFTGVQSYYWSSSTYRIVPSIAWVFRMIDGFAYAGYDKTTSNAWLWPVRAGQ